MKLYVANDIKTTKMSNVGVYQHK